MLSSPDFGVESRMGEMRAVENGSRSIREQGACI